MGLVGLIVALFFLMKDPKFVSWGMRTMFTFQFRKPPELPNAAQRKPLELPGLILEAPNSAQAAELYRQTAVWDVQLAFRSNEWAALAPKRIPPLPVFIGKDGSVVVRNPEASRPGILGVLGMDLQWASGNLTFAGIPFTHAPIRFKGNGTFVESAKTFKKPFKIDLSRSDPPRSLMGRSVLNLANLAADRSYLSDSMAYAFFQSAGVIAPRTAYARVRLSVEGLFNDRLLGLYALIENPDTEWAREAFGGARVTLFKPVTENLFQDLGDSWEHYRDVYSPRGKVKTAERDRLIQLCRLVTSASDADFAARLGEFIDLDAFARFMACQVLLSNYDSFLCNGQNYLMYLNSGSGKFGFIPWDLDHSWGEFAMVMRVDAREHASIEHPWVGEHRFLERCFAVDAFRKRYNATLRSLLETEFTAEKLFPQVDHIAQAIRPFVQEEGTPERFERFEQCSSGAWVPGIRDSSNPMSDNRPAHQIKRFILNRRISVLDQLDGRTIGIRPMRNSNN